MAFLVSALPWTTFWGGKVLGSVQASTNQQSPVGFFFAQADQHHAAAGGALDHGHGAHDAPRLSLDDLVQKARAAGARGAIELKPALNGGPVSLRDDHPRAYDEVWMQLDGSTGAVLTKVVWKDFPVLPKFISLGIDLHEGHFFGRINQIFNTLFATALVWLSVTGFIGWYKRRPKGGLAAPPKRAQSLPKAVIATGAALCVVLPMLGASVILIAIVDRLLGRFLPRTA
jgi:uncharacterized iron-regulated membrane protein